MDGRVTRMLGLKCMGIGMTTKKSTHLKVSRAKRSIGMTTKKPGDLKVRRRKAKLIAVRRQVLKNEPWYVSAAIQIGIKAADQGDKSSTGENSQRR
jgi:hypothetical protein